MNDLSRHFPFVALAGVLACGIAHAQFDPARFAQEPEAIAHQFPDPDVRFDTPAFAAGRTDLTTHAEVFAFLDRLAARSARVAIETIGRSQEGRALALVVLTGARGYRPALPTVLLFGQQHGNEPAGGEAALVLAERLALERPGLLEQVNVLIVPRANPDGAEHFVRVTANGTDVNRDHLLLRTPEAQALDAAVRRYAPQVMLDLHEFTVAGRWTSKFGGVMRADALLQAATTFNLDPAVAAAQAGYLDAARQALRDAGLRTADYHTTTAVAGDQAVYMGGINVDTGRNVGGLRNAVSILLETRGVGLGRQHLARRVNTHVIAAMALIERAAANGPALVAMSRAAGEAEARLACRGELVVAGRQAPERRTLEFLDAQSGAPLEVEVDWRSALTIETLRQRPRPCGYLIDGAEARAIALLRELGASVTPVASRRPWRVERYVVDAASSGRRQDGRGAIDDGDGDGKGIRILQVHVESASAAPAGRYFVSMRQPLAALVGAALEPDSQNSLAANRLLELDGDHLLRVTDPAAIAAATHRAGSPAVH